MRTEIKPLVNEYWAKGEFPRELIGKFRDAGLAALPYEGYGEHPAGREQPARRHAGDGAHPHRRLGAPPSSASTTDWRCTRIYRGGDQEQRDRWLPAMAAMDKIGAFAMTEPLGGSDVAGGMRTTARRDGDTWVLNGAKKWIGNATFADYVVVWARDDEDNQVKGFVVEKGTPGLRRRRRSRTRSRSGSWRTPRSP